MRIDTERLTIRPFREDDLAEFVKLLEMLEVPGWQMQRGRALEFLRFYISQYETMDIVHGAVCLGVFARGTNRLLGAAGAGEHDEMHVPEVFYSFLPEARGQGYASEACRAVTKWALSDYDVPYLVGTAGVDNPASCRVLEKSGYVPIEEKPLLVHITGETHTFRVYRFARISPCGANCAACERYPATCAGCGGIKGRVWWMEYMGGGPCAFYDCCVNKKALADCGQCGDFPCPIFHQGDPTKTPEENAAILDRQITALRGKGARD